MKKLYSIIAASMLIIGCSNGADDTYTAEQKQMVTFTVGNIDVDVTPLTPLSRATLASESITDLYIWEGTTLLAHQQSTDTDFGTFKHEFAYGKHTLTFVASKSTGQSWAADKTPLWTCTKVDDTFGKVLELTVAKGSSTSQPVELSRVVAKVQWTIEDKVPATAVSMDVSVTNHLSLTSSLAGANAATYSAEGVNTSSWAGTSNKKPYILVIPATFGSESDCTASITFKRTDGTVICSYTKDVTVLSNRCTNIHGSFFAINPTMEVTVNNAWSEQKDVDL